MMPSFRVKTPHAAIKIWNYVDRISAEGANYNFNNTVKEEIISTVSCSAIQTMKAKADPIGQFHFILAPTRNWTAVITPGSWCVIMMSNEPIGQGDFVKANPKMVKMVGRIETVRTQVTTNSDGSRSTNFLVSGQDWGHIFQSILYIDPLINDQKEDQFSQATSLFAAIQKASMDKDGNALFNNIRTNLQTLLNLFGKKLEHIEGKTPRLAKNTHTPLMPTEMQKFFGLNTPQFLDAAKLVTGALRSYGKYSRAPDGKGWINPYALAGSHSLWQVLQDNSNHALNELFCDIVWNGDKADFTLFNRIKPFAFRDKPLRGKSAELRSQFRHIPAHTLDDITILSVNAGTNWRDKYNFVEIKPEMSEFKIHENWVKQKTQAWDRRGNATFNREGFRPLIFATKQLPFKVNQQTKIEEADVESFEKWTALLQEIYFDTHRLLNGQITMTGSSEYISVGNNIMFNAELVGVKHNYNSKASEQGKKYFVLAHVENVKHAFHVDESGERAFHTTIEFVRGIIVDENKNIVGEGVLDELSIEMDKDLSMNDMTVIATPSADAPGNKE